MKIECVDGKPAVIKEEDDLIEKARWRRNFWRKVAENLISVKVWILFAMLLASTGLLFAGKLTAVVWGSANSGTITAVLGMREGFKVAKVRSNGTNGEKEFIPS
jgi:hypothetical protein